MAFVSEKKSFNIELKIEKDKPVTVVTNLPDQSAIDEFVLTFRFFIQKGEGTSFRKMEPFYESLQISQELKNNFSKARSSVNNYLDSIPRSIKFEINGQTPTNRDIMNVFIYGKLAHADQKLELIFDQWAKNKLGFKFIEMEFHTILYNIFRIVQCVKNINDKAINELVSSKT